MPLAPRPLLALVAAATLLAACAAPNDGATINPPSAAASATADDSTAALLRRLQALADGTGGGVGLHALHVESGRSVGLREAEPFFMASVTKLPLAVAVLRGVEAGRMRLGDTVAISPAQMNTGRSPIREASPGGTRMTVAELIRFAVSESDNTPVTIRGGGSFKSKAGISLSVGYQLFATGTFRCVAKFLSHS